MHSNGFSLANHVCSVIAVSMCLYKRIVSVCVVPVFALF